MNRNKITIDGEPFSAFQNIMTNRELLIEIGEEPNDVVLITDDGKVCPEYIDLRNNGAYRTVQKDFAPTTAEKKSPCQNFPDCGCVKTCSRT